MSRSRTRQTFPSPEQRCYWTKDDDGASVLIPQCYGCAVSGPEACTCDVAGSRLDRAETARLSAEHEVERLREKLHRQHARYQIECDMNFRLRQRVRELEAQEGR